MNHFEDEKIEIIYEDADAVFEYDVIMLYIKHDLCFLQYHSQDYQITYLPNEACTCLHHGSFLVGRIYCAFKIPKDIYLLRHAGTLQTITGKIYDAKLFCDLLCYIIDHQISASIIDLEIQFDCLHRPKPSITLTRQNELDHGKIIYDALSKYYTDHSLITIVKDMVQKKEWIYDTLDEFARIFRFNMQIQNDHSHKTDSINALILHQQETNTLYIEDLGTEDPVNKTFLYAPISAEECILFIRYAEQNHYISSKRAFSLLLWVIIQFQIDLSKYGLNPTPFETFKTPALKGTSKYDSYHNISEPISPEELADRIIHNKHQREIKREYADCNKLFLVSTHRYHLDRGSFCQVLTDKNHNLIFCICNDQDFRTSPTTTYTYYLITLNECMKFLMETNWMGRDDADDLMFIVDKARLCFLTHLLRHTQGQMIHIHRMQYEKCIHCDISLLDNTLYNASIGLMTNPYKALLLVDCDRFVLSDMNGDLDARIIDMDTFRQIAFYALRKNHLSYLSAFHHLLRAMKLDAECPKSDIQTSLLQDEETTAEVANSSSAHQSENRNTTQNKQSNLQDSFDHFKKNTRSLLSDLTLGEQKPQLQSDLKDLKESTKSLFSDLKNTCKSMFSAFVDSNNLNSLTNILSNKGSKSSVHSQRTQQKPSQSKQHSPKTHVSQQDEQSLKPAASLVSETNHAHSQVADLPFAGYKHAAHSISYFDDRDQRVIQTLHIDLNYLSHDTTDYPYTAFQNGFLIRRNGPNDYSCFRVINGIRTLLYKHSADTKPNDLIFLLAFIDQFKNHPEKLPTDCSSHARELMQIMLMPLDTNDLFCKAMQRYAQITKKPVLSAHTSIFTDKLGYGWKEPFADQYKYITKVDNNKYEVGYSERGHDMPSMWLYDVRLAYLYILEYYCHICL